MVLFRLYKLLEFNILIKGIKSVLGSGERQKNMKQFNNIFTVLLIMGNLAVFSQPLVVNSPVRFLALGDSYTIGQSVSEQERWPNQLMEALVKKGAQKAELNIIAQTGWTTQNLLGSLNTQQPDDDYTLVSLLIGVNNQFQGSDIANYPGDFRTLLETAIKKCGGTKEGVFVLSIPDYGYTPFGLSDQAAISEEIDAYNRFNKQIADEFGVAYFDITGISREAISKPSYLAPDNLHPSGKMYAKWVELILENTELKLYTSVIIKEKKKQERIAFPNPVQSKLTIQLPEKAKSIELYDNRGIKIWQQKKIKEFDRTINMSEWKSGIYFYRIETGKNNWHTGKIVKE